jgi:hypothetical protein
LEFGSLLHARVSSDWGVQMNLSFCSLHRFANGFFGFSAMAFGS